MRIHEDVRFQDLIDRIECLHIEGQTEEMKEVLEVLQTLAEKEQDDIGLTVAYFYRDILYGERPGSKEYMQYAKKALKIAKAKNIPYYRMKIENSLGIWYSEIWDFHSSLEYYLSAINIAQEHPEYAYASIILNNVGNLFIWLGEYGEAASYMERSYEKCVKENKNDRELIALVIINLIEIYSNLGDYKKVNELEERKEITFTPQELEEIEGVKLINKVRRLMKNGHLESAKDTLWVFEKKTENFTDYMFRCSLDALKLGMELRDFSLCSKLLDKMDIVQKKTLITSFSYDYATLKAQYYEIFKERLTKEIGLGFRANYYKESQKKINQLRNTYAKSLTVKIALEKAKNENRDVYLENEQLQRDMERDIFTNLYNKVSTEKYVRKAIANKKKDKQQALIVIDIDLFKRINDNYGHVYGDKVISAVAQIINSAGENGKIAGRFGGDEFLLFLDEKDSVKELEHIIDSILERVRTNIVLPDKRVKAITLSVGVCVIKPSMSFEEAFEKADAALYKAKEFGRNQYVLAEDEAPEGLQSPKPLKQ